jgi:Tfp pilus assembly protein PilO
MMRRAPLIAIVVAVLLTAAFWYLLYQPRRVEHGRYVEQTAQLDTEGRQLQAEIVTLREIKANEESYRSRLVRLREYIPDDPAQPETLEALQEAADSSGVEIRQMTFGEPELVEDAPETNEELTALGRIPTQMTVAGGYFQIVDLIRRIEVDMARAVKVDMVTVAEETEELFPTLSVTWTGHVFAVLPVIEAADEEGATTVDSNGEQATPTESPSAAATESSSDAATAQPAATSDGGTT